MCNPKCWIHINALHFYKDVLGFCYLLKLFTKYSPRVCSTQYRWGYMSYADLKERTLLCGKLSYLWEMSIFVDWGGGNIPVFLFYRLQCLVFAFPMKLIKYDPLVDKICSISSLGHFTECPVMKVLRERENYLVYVGIQFAWLRFLTANRRILD